MPFPTSGILGITLADIGTTPTHKVGTVTFGTDGTKYEYVYAMSTIAQYDAVAIVTSGNARPVSTAIAVSAKKIGFAQVAITSAYYGWVARQGNNIRVNVAANCAAGAQLYTTSTAGTLDDAVVTAGFIPGLYALTSISTATNTDVIAGSDGVVIQAAPGT